MKKKYQKDEDINTKPDDKENNGMDENPIAELLADKVDEETLKAVMEAFAKAKSAEDEEEKEEEEKEEEEKEEVEDMKGTYDAMPAKIMRMIADRDNLVKEVTPLVGTFDHAIMTSDDVANYACKKLGINAGKKEAKSVLKGYLAAQSKSNKKTFALDSANGIKSNGQDKALSMYKEGK